MGNPDNPGPWRRNARYAKAHFRQDGVSGVWRQGKAKLRRRLAQDHSISELSALDLERVFDGDWYQRFYGLGPDQTMFGVRTHFDQAGGKAGLAPSADQLTLVSTDHILHGAVAELVREDFAPEWYVLTYPEVSVLCREGRFLTALDHYLSSGAAQGHSPNDWFDEQWYLRTYPDVALAKSQGGVHSGFAHFLMHGKSEGRAPSAAARPQGEAFEGLTRPVGFDRLRIVEKTLTPMPFRIYSGDGTPRINFLIPTLDKNLMFGGYIAALNFVDQLLDRGWRVRLVIVNDVSVTEEKLRKQFENDALGSRILARAQVVQLARGSQLLDVCTDDRFVAYSMWTAYQADIFARAVGRRFTFFIQEYEPTFHHHDSWHALGASMYDNPHFAVFNNPMLRNFFAEEHLGVYAQGATQGDRDSVVFDHALSVSTAPSAAELQHPQRKLLFYGRPEAHAARNLYEVAVAGLRQAVRENVFSEEWQFVGVGTLATETEVSLGRGFTLGLRPRLPLGDYVRSLQGFDIGLSLQYAPHPGVVHFEMAACGMSTVTNTFSNRTAADLDKVNANLIGVPPTPAGIARGLAEAVRRTPDLGQRAANASAGQWTGSWSESFNETVMQQVEAEFKR